MVSNKKQSIWLALLLLFAFGLILRLTFFYISSSNFPTTTDEALTILIAKSIANGSRPLLFWGTPYQFPLESYLIAPFVHWLPTNTFGARGLLAIAGCLSPFGFYLVLRSAFKQPPLLAVALIVIPSAYIITLQAAYFIPQYTAAGVWAWILPLLAAATLANEPRILLVIVTGVSAGLALSNHLLSLPLVAAISLAICLGSNKRTLIRNSLIYIPALATGLIPYLTVYTKVKEAALTVHGSHSIGKGLARLFEPALTDNLKVLLGPELSLFPDYAHSSGYLSLFSTPVLLLFWAALTAATLIRLRRLLDRRTWPALELQDIFVLTTWLSLMAFAISKRGISGEYRYLLPVAWSFPFIAGVLLSNAKGRVRQFLSFSFLILIGVSIFNTALLIHIWNSPTFASEHQDVPRLGKLRRYLSKRDIHHCFASFWHSNRITFETREKIVCSQPYNDRFPGWPLPYRKQVEESSRVAYVLNNSTFARFKAHDFEAMLDFHRLTATTKQLGAFKVFHDFHFKDVTESKKIDSSELVLQNPADLMSVLIDNSRETSVRQSESKEIVFSFKIPRLLHRIRFFWKRGATTTTKTAFTVSVRSHNRWIVLRDNILPMADRIYMRRAFPIFFSDDRQDITFEPVRTNAVRIRFATPSLSWPATEIEFYEGTRAVSTSAE